MVQTQRSRFEMKESLAAVLLIVLAAALASIPLAGQLGFYRDDWHVLWGARVQGLAAVIDQHTLDRPLMGVIYGLWDQVLGQSPLGWQLLAFAVRAAGGVLFLWITRQIWPSNRFFTLYIAVLFTVYPGFYQQPNAHTYQNHLLALLFGLGSIAFSIRAFQTSGWKRIVMLALATLTGLICYLMFEWMIGLEGLRLVLLWLFSRKDNPTEWRKRLGRFAADWLPHLAGAVLFFIWRVFFFKSARSVTDVGALAARYLNDPAGSLSRLLADTAKDLVETLLLAWGTPLYDLANRARPADVFGGVVVALVGVALVLVYRKMYSGGSEGEETAGISKWLVLAGAVISVFAALLPPLLAERNVEFRDGLERYTLNGMAGAAIFAAAAIFLFIRSVQRWTIFSTLFAVGLLTQHFSGVYFRDFWRYQQQMWWQLSWRAPDLQDDTALVALLPPGYRLAEGYEVWGPANLIYRPGVNAVAISGEALNDRTIVYLTEQLNLGRMMRKVEYKVDYKNSLVISIPAAGSCLHVIDGEKPVYSMEEDPMVRLAGSYSRLELIDTEAAPRIPPEDIFGREPDHGWCYYYQKASLARQRQNWEEVVRLGEEARQKGLVPQDDSEWMPFYEGYVHTWNYERLNELAGILRSDHYFVVGYCQQFRDYIPDPNAKDQAEAFAIQNLCNQLEDIEIPQSEG